MVEDKHPIRNKVIASVITGIILAALSQVWAPASRFLASVWAILSASATVPVWVLALIAMAVLGLVFLIVRLGQVGVADSPPMGAERMPAANAATKGGETISISKFERDVLARIAKADGAPVPQDTIKRSLGGTNLRLQVVVDHLVGLDLVEVLEEVDWDEVVLLLTARGRQYALEQRLARVMPPFFGPGLCDSYGCLSAVL